MTRDAARACASCGERQHVRVHEGRSRVFCLSCLERGAAFDHPDLEEEPGEWD